MGKLGILLAVLATLALPAPVSARTMSAQDVLTVCLTTPKDPMDVLVYFHANGWADATKADIDLLRDAVALTFFATGGSPEKGLKENGYWEKLQKFSTEILDGTSKEPWKVLHHRETGAVLILFPTTTPKIGLKCRLSVPSAPSKAQEFHPKLPAPAAPALIESTLDGHDLAVSRVTIITNSVSISQPAVDDALGAKTDISAAFMTSINYPAWAVTP
jgi:hypothetical protein